MRCFLFLYPYIGNISEYPYVKNTLCDVALDAVYWLFWPELCPLASLMSRDTGAALHRVWPHHGCDGTWCQCASRGHDWQDSWSSWCTTGCPHGWRGLVPTRSQLPWSRTEDGESTCLLEWRDSTQNILLNLSTMTHLTAFCCPNSRVHPLA